MKIALISFKNDSGCPPLGLIQLGTYLKEKHHEVEIVDFNWSKSINPVKYDCIGISSMTKDYGQAIALARGVKKSSQIPIIIGGVHISTLPDSIDPIFNIGIRGEGELNFVKALNMRDLDRLKGHILESQTVDNIDSLPYPDWSLSDKRYFDYQPNTTWSEFCKEGVMLTSRGCPYNCVFCSTKSFWGNKVRFHSPAYVEGLVRNLVNQKITHIQVWDDLFSINIERLKEIGNRISKYNVKLSCQPRTDLISDKMCIALKEAKVKLCIFGFESGSQKILSYLKKDTATLSDNIQAIKLCRKHGLRVQGSVIFGSPNETEENMFDTLKFMRFAILNGVERIWSFILTPFPATEIWDMKKYDYNTPYFNWKQFSHQSDTPFFLTVTIEKFNELFSKAKKYENVFKAKKALMFLRNNPIKTIVYAIKNFKVVKDVMRRGV